MVNGLKKGSIIQGFIVGVCFLLSKNIVICAWTLPSQTKLPRQIQSSPQSATTQKKIQFQFWNSQQWKRKPRQRGVYNLLALHVEASQTSSTSSSSSSLPAIKDHNKNPEQIRVRTKSIKQQHTKKRQRYSIKQTFQYAKRLERQGKWVEACIKYEQILQRAPQDAYSHLALARLEARRERKVQDWEDVGRESPDCNIPLAALAPSKAEAAFSRGTTACPRSIHLWQAWAVYEETRGNILRARELFEEALTIDPRNPYVCQAYGLMEKKLGNREKAVSLFEQALEENSTAALVCSLGEILIEEGKAEKARSLYEQHLPLLKSEKDKIEVYLASAWLEERNFSDFDRAKELLQLALQINPESSLGNVALARLEGRIQRTRNKSGKLGNKAAAERLATACRNIEKKHRDHIPNDSTDGRVFNTLASLEVKNRNFSKAREVLRRGMEVFPRDHTLYQAAGRVEERLGNFTAARRLYGESLRLEPSAPTLVAFAMLELRHPDSSKPNYIFINGLFEEALLLDPGHGPAYNAYGNAEFQRGKPNEARAIFERGVKAQCNDAASLYHGYGKFELSLGNVDKARAILKQGLSEVRTRIVGMDSTLRDRTTFLSHTLGMLELNSNRPVDAIEIFKEGISRCGNSSQLLLGAALCEMKLGRDNSARALFERSVLSDKKHAQAWQAWGVMETRAGKLKIAAALFQSGIRNAPDHGPLWYGYASLEEKKGSIQNARVLYAAGIKKVPYYCLLYQGWAMLELKEGNHMSARKLISESLTKNKNSGSGWLIAAEIEEDMGNEGLVGLLLRRGIECAPNAAELYNKLGSVLVGKGEYASAREVFEKGMDVNPLYAPLYHSLAELEARVFNLDGLAKLNKKAMAFFNNNAMVPAPSSSEAFSKQIRAKRSRELPQGVAALAEKIVEDEINGSFMGFEDINDVDPMETLESMTGFVMEDEFVQNLYDVER